MEGEISAQWNGDAIQFFEYDLITSDYVHVYDSEMNHLYSGPLSATTYGSHLTVSGKASYSITGMGKVTIYPPATQGMAISCVWNDYFATVSSVFGLTIEWMILNQATTL
jgi:hypothetical protein